MNKLIFFLILGAFLGGIAHAGEHHDKFVAKLEEQKREQQQRLQMKYRDLHAEDELRHEIWEEERHLRELRSELYCLHQDNLRKYGAQAVVYPYDQR